MFQFFSCLSWRISFLSVCFVLLISSSQVFAYRSGEPDNFSSALVNAAIERTKHWVIYDGSYRKIAYPNGDVPSYVGVCTDVVIRSYRELGIDLQKDVHEDMASAFSTYPNIWGLSRPDKNIDHRRVPNLKAFFQRHGIVLSASDDPTDYKPGDIVTWVLKKNQPHIGIVIDQKSDDGKRPLIVHNIGWGPEIEDMLFDYTITGHYRYYGALTD